MNTQLLARQLGLSEIIPVDDKKLQKYNVQDFAFLIVLDFESTCWERNDYSKGMPEIIEFSAVLYDTEQNKIITEFQQYVMPMEQPKLSTFCTTFTGITQNQVEHGVPLQTSLMLFSKWVQKLTSKFDLIFDTNSVKRKRKCVIATWSDWDLATCLYNECKRKNIIRPEIFNEWIDLKALYKEHFNRKPKNLMSALQDVGLTFQGNQHCGLHDARNTALLAGQMIATGLLLRITSKI